MRMRTMALGLLVGLGMLAPSAKAQQNGFSDPFFLYYSYYLPRQAALAAQPQPDDYIRARAQRRQVAAVTERGAGGLFDPLGSLGAEELDPLRPFGTRSSTSRQPRLAPTGVTSSNVAGLGPPAYYSRHGSYFPGIRSGRNMPSARPPSVVPAGRQGLPMGFVNGR